MFTPILARFTHNGDGTATAFAVVDYPVFQKEQLVVYSRVTATDTLTLLAEGVNFNTVVAAPLPGIATITPVANIAVGTDWIVLRMTLTQQTIAYSDSDTFPSAAHEEGLDRLGMMAAELLERAERSVRQARTEPYLDMTIPRLADRLSKLAAYDASGQPTAIDPLTLNPPAINVAAMGQTLLPLATYDLWLTALNAVENGGLLAKVQAGTNAARIATAPAAFGTGLWHATDTQKVWYSDGAAWTLVAGSVDVFPNATFPAFGTADRILVDSDLDEIYHDTGAAFHLLRGLPPGYIDPSALWPVYATGATFSIAAGKCRNSVDTLSGGLVANWTKALNLVGDWVEGDTNNSVPTNVIAAGMASKVLPVFAIFKLDGTTDIGVDTEPNRLTAATLLHAAGAAFAAGYRTFRRIGWLTTTGAGAIAQFHRVNDWCFYDNLADVVTATIGTDTTVGNGAEVALLGAPAECEIDLHLNLANANGGQVFHVRSPIVDTTVPVLGGTVGQITRETTGTGGGYWSGRILVDASRQVQVRGDASDATVDLKFYVRGWRDSRAVGT